MQRLTESPDSLSFNGNRFDYYLGSGFFIVNNRSVVYGPGLTHQAIFRVLDRVNPSSAFYSDTDAASAKKNMAAYLRKNGVSSNPTLTQSDLQWYFDNRSGQHGKFRMDTRAGRAWTLKEKGRQITVISFWPNSNDVSDADIALVVQALGKGSIFIEFLDSKEATEYRKVTRGETGTLKSKLYPDLTAKQIADILVKRHVSPHTLTAKERKVADEFRSVQYDADFVKRLNRGYTTPAEARFRGTVGDSRIERVIKRIIG